MNTDLIAFAVKTENAHIAVVDGDHVMLDMHFRKTQDQLHGMIESVHHSERKIRLINGTLIYFKNATRYEQLRSLRLDRIETTSVSLYIMPDLFLETRLAPGVTPEEGISLSKEL